MKKFLSIALIIAAMILAACGRKISEQTSSQSYREDKIIYASPERSCTCVVNMEDIDTVIEVAETRNAMLYNVLVKTGKIILVRSDTKVACYYSEAYQGFVPVVFYEGEFKGRRAYVMSKRLE